MVGLSRPIITLKGILSDWTIKGNCGEYQIDNYHTIPNDTEFYFVLIPYGHIWDKDWYHVVNLITPSGD